MTYRHGGASPIVLRAMLFAIMFGVFFGGMAFAIYVIGSIFGPIGLGWNS
jgi:hypothetical protein